MSKVKSSAGWYHSFTPANRLDDLLPWATQA